MGVDAAHEVEVGMTETDHCGFDLETYTKRLSLDVEQAGCD